MTQAAPRPQGRARPARRPARSSPPGVRLAAGARLFDRYRLERPIGRGGSAEVWRAHDERLDRTVAIKVLHRHLRAGGPWTGRFVAEARAAAGLTHPAIVPVFDVVDDPATPAIVFRYVDGETLAELIGRRGRMPAAEAAAIAADLAGALAHAHRVGLLHRDVKPGNVLIDAEGRAQLVDFGIARALLDPEEQHGASGDVLGTLRYMAPEQLAGRPLDPRTDLYALGLVLHEMLAGRPAFVATSPAGLVDAQRGGPPAPPPGTPPPLAALLAELLAADPTDRPLEAASVESRLRAVAGSATSPIAVREAPPVDPGDERRPEADTEAFAAPPTVAISRPDQRVVADVPAMTRPRPAADGSRAGRHSGEIALGGALAGIAAVLLAALVLGGGLGSAPAAGTQAGPTASEQPSIAPAVEATRAPKAAPPGRGRGHGHGEGGGGD